jgi:hypothetical protein
MHDRENAFRSPSGPYAFAAEEPMVSEKSTQFARRALVNVHRPCDRRRTGLSLKFFVVEGVKVECSMHSTGMAMFAIKLEVEL